MQARQNKPNASLTALSVAEGLLTCSRLENWRHLVTPEAAKLSEHFIKCALKDSPVNLPWLFFNGVNQLPAKLSEKIYKVLDKDGGGEGYIQHCAMRKLFIEQQVRAAIDAGAKKVFILGAGYETLALRLHKEFQDVHFYELDRGRTREIKISALNELRLSKDKDLKKFSELGNNLHFIDCDLSTNNWYENFNNEETSVVIAEGLTMYLSEQEVSLLLDALRDKLMNEHSQLIISFKETLAIAKLLNTQLKNANETFKCAKNPNEVVELAMQKHFSIPGKVRSFDFQFQANNQDFIKIYKKNPRVGLKEDYYIFNFDKAFENINNPELIPNLKIDIPKPLEKLDAIYCRRV